MKFMTDDGRVFDAIEKAEEHEKDIAKKQMEKDKLRKQMKEREDSINNLLDNVSSEIKEFKKDYHKYPNVNFSVLDSKFDGFDIFDNFFR